MPYLLYFLLTLSTIPFPPVSTTHVDYIELNHFHDENGKEVFTQFLFWKKNDNLNLKFNKEAKLYIVADWKLAKGNEVINLEDKSVTFFNDSRALVKITSNNFIESWTQYDIELYDRQERGVDTHRGGLLEYIVVKPSKFIKKGNFPFETP